MSNTLYLECYSGISGDMTVAALLDLGAEIGILEKALKSLPVTGFEVKISRVKKAGLDICDFNVILDKEHENHDHDMKYLYGTEENHVQEYIHVHKHEESTLHEHHHDHESRGLPQIIQIINQSEITVHAKEIAIRIFTIIAEAEAKAHGVSMDVVHFHEVGAIDSIVDIVAVAVCLDNLSITEVIVPELYEGKGFVRCQHGTIPIPVPAVANIASAHDLQLHITNTEGELVTPTGAAIVAAIRTTDQLPEKFTIVRTGIGAGKRNYDRPSMLRAMLIQDKSSIDHDTIYKLESNIDDCTGEALGYTMDRLFEAGAMDVHYLSVYMKKNRPAYQLTIICKKEDIEKLEQIVFEETTTIGIRRIQMERTVLKREVRTIQTALGEAQVKICELVSGKKIYPEYSSVIALAKEHKISYTKVYQMIQNAAQG